VRDSFLTLFPMVSNDWGQFSINLKKHTCRYILDKIKRDEAD